MDEYSFLIQAMIYLAAAVVMVPLSKKLGLGSVLGYLIAGIVIGPAALGIIGNEGEDIMHYAEFGVVMMLFIIGLELEPELLWRLRKSILGLGGLQVLLTTIIVSIFADWWGVQWQESLAIGMIVSLSSTAIVLQTLTEKGLMRTGAGRRAFSVLLFQDIAVIPMLAIFPLLSTQKSRASFAEQTPTLVQGLPGWAHTLVVISSVATIIIAGRFLVKPLLRIVAATKLKEVFTATALLLVIGIAVLMTQVGISPALGTFLAGVVLANSEYKHELESDIDPFKGLLLGLFFIAVGASINFQLIMHYPITIFGMVVVLVTVKTIILFILGKFSGLQRRQNFLFSFALSQVGEFAFVLIAFAMHLGITSKNTSEMLMAGVAISMAFTPLMLLINDKILQPRLARYKLEDEKVADTINEDNEVIIAGFGHFGNTVGRFLRAHNIGTTILDADADRVERLRKLGFKVYYGDACRYELLLAAGAQRAKIIIIALEPAEKRLELVNIIKKHFPQLNMFVRANNRYDAYNLYNAGMLNVYRETVDTSLRLGVNVLQSLGHDNDNSQMAAHKFLKHDEENLKKLAAISDRDEYISTARETMEELERILREDLTQLGKENETD